MRVCGSGVANYMRPRWQPKRRVQVVRDVVALQVGVVNAERRCGRCAWTGGGGWKVGPPGRPCSRAPGRYTQRGV